MGTKGVEEPLIIFTTGSGIATGVNSFQLTGSVVVQPTPYVSISRENIHNGKRHGARDTITLDGQLTGYTCPDRTNNFDYLTSFQDQLIQKFQENLQTEISDIQKMLFCKCDHEWVKCSDGGYDESPDYICCICDSEYGY